MTVEKRKLFCMSDIHGAYDAMLVALRRAGYDEKNPTHQIVCGGDYFGRGEVEPGDSFRVWEYLISSIHVNPPICIRGNHESIIRDIFRKRYVSYTDVCNGEDRTIAAFANVSREQAQFDPEAIIVASHKLGNWIDELPWYYETENYIFVHGFIPFPWSAVGKWDKYTDHEWDRASWTRTDADVRAFKHHFPDGIGKTIVVGHWHAAHFIEEDVGKPGQYGRIWYNKKLKIHYLDCCTAMGLGMQVLVVEDNVRV